MISPSGHDPAFSDIPADYFRIEEPDSTEHRPRSYSDVRRGFIANESGSIRHIDLDPLFADNSAHVDESARKSGKANLIVSIAVTGMRISEYVLTKLDAISWANVLGKIHTFATLPTSVFGLLTNLVSGFYEIYNLIKICTLRKTLRSTTLKQPNHKDHLNDVKELVDKRLKAFSELFLFSHLSNDQLKQLDAFVEKQFPTYSDEQKGFLTVELIERWRGVKFDTLQRWLSPTLAKEIQEKIHTLKIDLSSDDIEVQKRAFMDAISLLNQVDTQINKKILIHTIGLVGVVLAIIATVLLFAMPQVGGIILALTLISVLFSIVRYIIDNGVFNQSHWHFSFKSILPDCIKKHLDKPVTNYKPTPLFTTDVANLHLLR